MDILIHRHKSLHHPPPPCLFLFVQDTEYAAVFLASRRLTKSRIFFVIVSNSDPINQSPLGDKWPAGTDGGLLTSISDVLVSSPNPPQDSSTLTQNTFTPLVSLFLSFTSVSSRSLQDWRCQGIRRSHYISLSTQPRGREKVQLVSPPSSILNAYLTILFFIYYSFLLHRSTHMTFGHLYQSWMNISSPSSTTFDSLTKCTPQLRRFMLER